MRLHISSSSLSDAQMCRKKFYYSHILGYRPKKVSRSLSIGKVIHECFDMHSRGEQDIIKHIEQSYNMPVSDLEVERQLVDKYTVLGMWVNYPHATVDFKTVKSEFEFMVPLDGLRGVTLRGRVDGVVQHNGKLWIREFKTTSWDMAEYERKASVSSQGAAYIYGVSKYLGVEISGIIYDILKKPRLRKRVSDTSQDFADRIYQDYKDRPEFYFPPRYMSYRSSKEIAEFEKDTVVLTKDLRRRIKHKDWYRNTDSCYAFKSECPYKTICWDDNPDNGLIDSLYTKGGGSIMKCPKCDGSRWKTKIKNVKWECRKCGHIKMRDNDKGEVYETKG